MGDRLPRRRAEFVPASLDTTKTLCLSPGQEKAAHVESEDGMRFDAGHALQCRCFVVVVRRPSLPLLLFFESDVPVLQSPLFQAGSFVLRPTGTYYISGRAKLPQDGPSLASNGFMAELGITAALEPNVSPVAAAFAVGSVVSAYRRLGSRCFCSIFGRIHHCTTRTASTNSA